MFLNTLKITAIFTISICINLFSQDENWSSFRGNFANGISENHKTATQWDLEKSVNIKWKTKILGLGFSSPVIWGDKVFLTTAISGVENPEVKIGLYGDIMPVNDSTEHKFKVYCINKSSGKILWEKTSHVGIPKVKRHPKSTHANSSIATDGKHVIVFFGSEGLFCYDMDGNLNWKKDFGKLESSFFMYPAAEWGFASSPIIHEGVVIVQCDVMKNSFLGAFDVKTGKEIWRTERQDVPTWGTPAIHVGKEKTQIIVNGYKHLGGYDFNTGKEIWKITDGGDIPVPTPIVVGDVVFVNSAHGKMSPIYAINLSAQGDISLKNNETSNENIIWSVKRGGSYMQTPIVYKDFLYNLAGNGLLTCYNAQTGAIAYKETIGKMSSFTASGIVADDKLYFPSEQGDILVVKAGEKFELLSSNPMNDICMASPAASNGVLFIRTLNYLVAVQEK